MKKTLASLALVSTLGGASLMAFDLPELTLDAKGTFDTEYVYRGRKQGQQNFQFGAETGTELLGGHIYAGTWFTLMLQDSFMGGARGLPFNMNEVAPYIGYSYGISDMFMLDAGYIAHLYTGLESFAKKRDLDITRNTNEIYFGLAADVLLSPKMYFSYDFDREEFCMVLNGGYSYDLSQFGLTNFSLEAKAEIGYDNAKRPFGIKNFEKEAMPAMAVENYEFHKDYFFFGLGADVAYKFNENAKAKFGVRYAANTTTKTAWANVFTGEHKNMCWFTSSVECSF